VARIFGLLALIFFVFVTPLLAQNYPTATGYVNDFASLYSADFRQSLNSQLVALDKQTTVQFVVVTVNNLEGISIEEYANELFKQWTIGQKGKDNGLLLLISKEDRQLRFEVGYGLEGSITDGTAGSIIRNDITPSFKEGDYEAGTQAGVNQIFSRLDFNSGLPTPTPTVPKLPFSTNALVYAFIFFIYLISYMARSREFFAGGVVGFIVGLIFTTLTGAAILALVGFLLDFILSRNYKQTAASGKPTDFFSTFGGFKSGGGWGGGGGGGFSGGGGRSGGGGASGGW
jgi:uncharacterized protein